MRTRLGMIAIVLAGTGCATVGTLVADPETRLLHQTVSADMVYINGVLERGDRRVSVSVFQADCRSGSGNIGITNDFVHARDSVAASLNGGNPGDRVFTELCAVGMRLVAQQQRRMP